MNRIARVLRFWFTFDAPVTRRVYFPHGAALAIVKYLADATLVWTTLRVAWTPWDYLATGAEFSQSKLAAAPPQLLTLLSLWTLPFLWIGLTMSIRRAIDAGYSAWLALLFFVPVVNYGVMALLSLLPSRARHETLQMPRPDDNWLPSAFLSAGLGVGIDIGMVFLSVYGLRQYGISLFLGTPFVAGAICAFVFNRRYAATRRQTFQLVFLMLAATAGVMFTFGFEGAICLLMASPLAIGIGVLGALAGRAIALRDTRSARNAFVALAILPSATPILSPAATEHFEVRSAITIAAPPEVVWSHVIAFPDLAEPSSFVRRMGIAYPRRAYIEGTGVGAVRYCEFSTGAFVEPITVWEPGKRLAFDVSHSPAPLREWSPYARLVPPHLDGYFQARRGEFRLVRLSGNRTRLEGSTWYTLRIGPSAYWSFFADLIVTRIHQTVLRHIAAVATAPTADPR